MQGLFPEKIDKEPLLKLVIFHEIMAYDTENNRTGVCGQALRRGKEIA